LENEVLRAELGLDIMISRLVSVHCPEFQMQRFYHRMTKSVQQAGNLTGNMSRPELFGIEE